ncbi:MAG: glutathione S-transferase family protein [Proteobacteria bacterium]|nr:MAG: glutathione S-transferase family protein [Pseudomonadota bacterium]
MSASELHLISFDICPYVQRAMILLNEKNADFRTTYIDLAAKPDWFLKISPLGKVPVLVVDETVLFESAVICEYIDETQGEILHPADPLERAKHRAWMEYSSALLGMIYSVNTATEEQDFVAKKKDLLQKIQILHLLR